MAMLDNVNSKYRKPTGTNNTLGYPARPGSFTRPGTQNPGNVAAPYVVPADRTKATYPPVLATPAPPPSGVAAQPFQVTPQGSTGLSNMGIPNPPSYTPRAPMSQAIGAVNGIAGSGDMPILGRTGGPTYNDLANINRRVNNYTGGVISSSVPVEPGAWHGSGTGPTQAAAIGAWQNDQKRLGLEQAFGYRGPQMALTDYGYDDAGNWVLHGKNAVKPTQAPMQGSAGTGNMQTSIGTAGAAGAGGGAGAVAGAYDQAQIDATNANEQRYRDILSGYGSAFDRQTANVAQAGQVQSAALNRQFDNLQSKNLQDATSRGLAGSTLLPSMRRGTENSRAQAQNELADQVRQQQLGVDQQATQATLGFMERRDDNSPDLNQALALAQAMGQGGDGSGGTGSVPYNGAMMGVDYVNLQGNQGQQANSGYMTPAMLAYIQSMQGQQQQGPSYMQRQRQAIINSNQQAAIQKALNQPATKKPAASNNLTYGNLYDTYGYGAYA